MDKREKTEAVELNLEDMEKASGGAGSDSLPTDHRKIIQSVAPPPNMESLRVNPDTQTVGILPLKE